MKLLWIFLSSLLNCFKSSNFSTNCGLSSNNVWTCDGIPLDIPNGIARVHIQQFMFGIKLLEINYTSFQSLSWKSVTHLEFSDMNEGFDKNIIFTNGAFRDLHNLEVLRLHSRSKIRFEPLALLGLEKVTTLDFSECVRLKLEYIAAALNGSDKVPNLEQLLLSRIQYFWSPIRIDREFSKCLALKPLFHLDLSWTRVSILELNVLNDLKTLTNFKISGAMISQATHDAATPVHLEYIEIFDMSYIIIEQNTIKNHLSVSNVNFTINDLLHLDLILAPKVMNTSNILRFDVMLNNIKIRSNEYFKSWTRGWITKGNKIRRFDIEFESDNIDFSSIKLFNLAQNGMEYIHPSIFDCMSNLEHLDLSDNNLFAMYEEKIHIFTELLKSSKNLKFIQMASNQLIDIPEDFFDGNDNLEVINLAGNRLTQVHFKLHHLRKLQVLNLVRNHIKIIDEISMDNIDSLSRIVQYVDGENTDTNITINVHGNHAKVDITFNPLMCDGCETLHSVRWLVKTKQIGTISKNISCKCESGIQIHVDEEAVKMVQDICYKKTKNILLITLTALVSVVFMVICVVIYKRRKNRRKQAKRNDIINILRADEDRFFVFLSYCSEDVDFVTAKIFEPLNEGLQRIIDTDRNLICLGDIEFRLGQQLHDELIRCIEQCTVFISVISNQYCNSNFCKEEFNQAFQMKTPVLLMMKDEVDVGLMTPAMKLLFRNNVRILWENNDGEYRLRTSWENVCDSILNLATN